VTAAVSRTLSRVSEQPGPRQASGTATGAARPARGELHWPPQLTILAAIGLQLLLPDRLSLSHWSKWVIAGLEAGMLVALLIAAPTRLEQPHSQRRRLALTTTALASLANGIALVQLSRFLLHHRTHGYGHALIVAGAEIWLTNVLVFSLWYWEMDRGGPGRRAVGDDGEADFLFPQMSERRLCAGWRPQFADYLYVSLTNAAAFSPTDTLPLTVSAKMVMGLQSLISLVTIGLVVSRAVNIL
jgi:hypothetical protein